MNTIKIAPGCDMPWLGFGTWKIDQDAAQAVLTALHTGFTHIDCAPIYGNEADVGRALSHFLGASTGLRRRLWLTSKLWNADHHPERVRQACVRTLNDLGVDHLDLYLVHWPVGFRDGVRWPESPEDIVAPTPARLRDTWGAMESLVSEGLVRSIGVSNFNIAHLEDLLEHARIAPAVNQIECHPYLPQRALAPWCEARGIHVTAYSPLGSPDRPEGLRHPGEHAVLDDPTVKAVAWAHDVQPAQVLLAWHRAHGRSAICKSVSRQRLIDNAAAGRLSLGPADLHRLDAIAIRQRYVNPAAWFMPGSPLTEHQLWHDEPHPVAVDHVLG